MDDTRQRELTEEAIELLPQLVRLHKATLAMPCEVASVPYGQMRIMAHLYHSGRSTVGQVAAGIGVSLATASELVDRLVEHGWVERGVNPADRRQVQLSLTPDAIEVGDQFHAMRRSQVESAFARLSPEDRPAFVRGLRALVDSFEETMQSNQAVAQTERLGE